MAETSEPTAETSLRGARRPGWYHGWTIVAVLVLAQTASLGLTTNSFTLFLNDWSKEFGTPVSTLTAAWTALSFAVALVVPFAGVVADRTPARWLFGLALAALVGFHLVVSFASAGWQIVALYLLVLPLAMGFSAAVPSQALVSRWFVRRVGLAMGITAFGIAVAGVFLPPIVVWLLPIFEWRGVWRLGALFIAAVILPLALITLRDRPRPEEGVAYLGAAAPVFETPRLRTGDILRRPNFWFVVGSAFPLHAVFGAISINLAPMVTSHGISPAMAGVLLSLMSAAALCAKFATGVLADRVGNRLPVMGLCLACAAGLALLVARPDDSRVLTVALVLIGLSGGGWTLLASATAREFGAADFGRAFGLVCAATTAGSFTPPVLARIQELSGDYAPGLVALAVLSLAGAALALVFRERRRIDVTTASAPA